MRQAGLPEAAPPSPGASPVSRRADSGGPARRRRGPIRATDLRNQEVSAGAPGRRRGRPRRRKASLTARSLTFPDRLRAAEARTSPEQVFATRPNVATVRHRAGGATIQEVALRYQSLCFPLHPSLWTQIWTQTLHKWSKLAVRAGDKVCRKTPEKQTERYKLRRHENRPRVFQDRYLKPLGHPSKPLKLFSDLRGA
jgi:hypothetical protein